MARPLHPRLRLTPSVRYADTLAASALSDGSAATNVPVSLASTGLPWPVAPDNAVLLGSR